MKQSGDYIEQDGLQPQGDHGLNFQNLFQNKFNLVVAGLIAVGIILLGIGGWFFVSQNKGLGEDIKIISGESAETNGEITVHVDGAVARPGIYKLATGSRVNDVIAAAGGLTGVANSTKINLAAKVSDGQKVYIFSVNDTVSSGSGGQVSGAGDMVSAQGININTASEAELDKLPGVGPVTAGKITGGRPYASLDELVSKKAVGKATFEKIKNLISL